MEILAAIALFVAIAAGGYASLVSWKRSLNVTAAGLTKKEMTIAARLYYADMGFYPPDVNRGWDPGFEQAMPWNPDGVPPSPYNVPATDCVGCPADWEDIVAAKWKGPYLEWPNETPWGGKYDYNYWETDITRNGCLVPAGIYAGAQGDYYGANTIPADAEQLVLSKGFDGDECMNGESQLILKQF